MTKHSTLTNPDDLHYAKLRLFTGSPLAVTPDFIGQVLCATDTNKIYRAASLNEGGLVGLSTDGNGNGNPSPAFASVGTYPPDFMPDSIGQLYYQTNKQRLYCASRLSPLAWVTNLDKVSMNFTLDNQQGLEANLILYYSEEITTDFTEIIETGIGFSNNDPTINAYLKGLIVANGKGYYAFGYSFYGTQVDCQTSCNIGNSLQSNNFLYGQSVGASCMAGGLPISPYVIFYESNPEPDLDFDLNVSMQLLLA